MVQLQGVAIALGRGDQAGEDVLGIVEPQLGGTEAEIARRRHQQQLEEPVEIGDLHELQFQIPCHLVEKAVEGDRLLDALLADLACGPHGRCRFNLFDRQTVVLKRLSHPGFPR